MQIRENLKRGTIDMIILNLLKERPMYGYEILQEIKRRSNEQFILKDGSMYPILYRLIDNNFVSDEAVLVGRRRTRIYYHITDEGIVFLDKIKEEYMSVTEGVEKLLNYVPSPDEEPITEGR